MPRLHRHESGGRTGIEVATDQAQPTVGSLIDDGMDGPLW